MSEHYRCHPGCMRHDEYPTSHHPDCAVQATQDQAAELERLRATLARVEALEPFLASTPSEEPVVSYHALCTALGVALADDGGER